MAWQGKIIGGTLGSMFGPWGAIAGAAAGHFFVDRKRQRDALRQRQASLALLAGTLYRFAIIDGPYQPKEESVILAVLDEANGELGKCFPPQAIRGLVDEARSIPDAAERLVTVTRANPELAGRLFFWLLRVAVSDGLPTEQERGFLAQIAPPLGLSREDADSLFRLFVPVSDAAGDADGLASAYRELGLSPGASADEIKKAFREKSLKYHPDRHIGLDADMRELAAEKFAQVKAAYDRLNGVPVAAAPRFCKDPKTGGAVLGEPGDIVRCPVCGQLVRLPETFDPLATRCPTCQVLLAQ